MMTRRPLTFDADALRAFVTGMELGSFALAAERLGVQRRRSALSLKSLSSRAARRWYKRPGVIWR